MIKCCECGSVFETEEELLVSRDECIRNASGCSMAHAEVCLER